MGPAVLETTYKLQYQKAISQSHEDFFFTGNEKKKIFFSTETLICIVTLCRVLSSDPINFKLS